MANYSGDVNVPANEVNIWKRLPVDTGPSLEPCLSTSSLLINAASCEPEEFLNSLFDERMETTNTEQTNIYPRSKMRTTDQGMDAIDAMTQFSYRQCCIIFSW